MKKFILRAIFALAFIAPLTLSAQLPGPVMAESMPLSHLPLGAQKFINTYFSGNEIIKCEFEPGRGGGYEVEFKCGTEIDFTSTGGIKEISANDNQALNSRVVKSLLPKKAYQFLEKNSFQTGVNNIEWSKDRIEVELTIIGPNELVFTPEGKFVTLKD